MIIRIKLKTNKKAKRVIFIPIDAILKNGDRVCILSESLPKNGGKTMVMNIKQVMMSWIVVISTFKCSKYLGKYVRSDIPYIPAIKAEFKVNITDFFDIIKKV